MNTIEESIKKLEKWRKANSPFSWWQIRSAQENGCVGDALFTGQGGSIAIGRTVFTHGRTARAALDKLVRKLEGR